ncbi:uncharacterized protein LOC122989106 isoform X1 [Thunnus albacares]|uniref:uncharacterized protein LOC122989106 isoform X1 n=1 Tax=Thunnus albacares TaxID=8236 RepID=UPI001CF6FB09|nr:uncharacterized protein LOC122989106 isoform X1 [Thunnus albacares]
MVSNMTAMVETLIPARPVHIPALDRHNPKPFSTSFQEDFQPVFSKKVDPVSEPIPADVDHKDLRHNKEYLTEVKASYQRHPLPQITRAPCRTRFCTNFKMQTDPGEIDYLTTTSQKFRPQPFQPPPTSIRPSLAIKKIQQVEKLPESIQKASFPPQHGSPLIKATVKHLAEGFPTIKGDGRHRSFVSQYNNTFQGAWSRPAQPVEKHSSVSIGDPEKIRERETTHAASFSRPAVCRPPVVKERLKLNLGNFSNDPWSSTARETFCYHKLEDPVVLTRRNRNFSSVPKGDTDMGRNKERMSVTTNRNSFSNLNNTELSVHVPGNDLITKSHVQFSPPRLSGLYYTTTTTEDYSKRDGERAKPATQLPSHILRGPAEHGVNLSTTGADFLPMKTRKQTPCLSQQRGHIKFPLAHQHFSTTHKEHYTAKPLILQHPGCSQFLTHFVIQ